MKILLPKEKTGGQRNNQTSPFSSIIIHFFPSKLFTIYFFFPCVSKKIHVICQANLIKGRLAHFLFSISRKCSNVGREECNKNSQLFSFGTLLTNFKMLRYIDELFKNRVIYTLPSGISFVITIFM